MALSESTARAVKEHVAGAVADQARLLGTITPDMRAIEHAADAATHAADHNASIDAAREKASEQTQRDVVAQDIAERIGLRPGDTIENGPIVGEVTLDKRTGKVLAARRVNEAEWLRANEAPSSRARRNRWRMLRSRIEWRHRIEMVWLSNIADDVKAQQYEAIYMDSIRAFGDPECPIQKGI